MLSESNKLNELKAKVQRYNHTIAVLYKTFYTEETPEISNEEPDSTDEGLYFYTKGPNGNRISGSSAISLIFRYCAMLPQDAFGCVTPLCWYNKNTKTAYMKLPQSCPVRWVLEGNSNNNMEKAKKSVFLKAVEELYHHKEINENFAIRDRTNIEESYRYLYPLLPQESITDESASLSNGHKRKRKYDIKYAENLSHCLPVPEGTAYLHVITMSPDCDRPEESRDSVLYDLFHSSDCYAILTSKRHPKIFDFPLFAKIGQINCSLMVNASSMELNVTDLEKIKKFHFFTFYSLLGVVKRFEIFDCHQDHHSFYVVPVKRVDDGDFVINWDVINLLNDSPEIPSTDDMVSKIQNVEDFFCSVVYPNYRNTASCNKMYYIVTSIDNSQTPLSKFPSEDFDNYCTYFKEKYDVQIIDKTQPLIEVRSLPVVRNYITSQTAIKRKIQKDIETYQVHLVPELCRRLTYSGSLWLKATLLPSALHRITTASLIHDVRALIISETNLGIPEVKDECSWLPLQVNAETDSTVKSTKRVNKNEVNLAGTGRLMQNVDYCKMPIDPFRNMCDYAPCDLKHYMNQRVSVGENPSRLLSGSKDVQKNVRVEVTDIDVPELAICSKVDIELGPELRDFLKVFTCRQADDIVNLEKLEFIGDSFLKFSTTLYLYKSFSEHEGVLSLIKDKIVGNENLYYCALSKGLHKIIQVNKFEPKSDWEAPLFGLPHELKRLINENGESFELDYSLEMTPKEKLTGILSEKTLEAIKYSSNAKNETVNYIQSDMCVPAKEISDKSVADSVEALLGLFVMDCGLFGGFEMLNWLGILPRNKGSYKDLIVEEHKTNAIEDLSNDILNQVSYKMLEDIIGYQFKNKSLLLQALIHPSFPGLSSYQRLEFLGDAVLDFLVAIHLFKCDADLGPGDMTDAKSSIVNNVTLACISVKYNFHKFLVQQCPPLVRAILIFVDFQRERNNKIDDTILFFHEENEPPLAEAIEVPKALGDLFESLIGAVFLDSGNSLHTAWKVFYKLAKDVLDDFTLNPPKSAVRMLYEKCQSTPNFVHRILRPGVIETTCKIIHNGDEHIFCGIGRNKNVAKLCAAKIAVRFLLDSSRSCVC